MPISEEEKKAYNDRCKQNFREYDSRIRTLEQAKYEPGEAFKRIQVIKSLQRELMEKDDTGRPRICLFDKEPLCTRQKFFERLQRLFEASNRQNKEWISNLLQQCEVMSREDHSDHADITKKLKDIQQHWYEVPKQDSDKNALKQRIDNLFAGMKNQGSSFPQMEPLLAEIRQYLQVAGNSVARLPRVGSLTPADYFPCIQAMKEVHTHLKDIHQRIKQAHERLKAIQSSSKGNVYKELERHYHSLQQLWNDDQLSNISTWCETLAAENYTSIAQQVEPLEIQAESVTKRDEIKRLHAEIKTLEATMMDKDDKGFYRMPLKKDQLQELFARTSSLKKRLQASWEGLGASQPSDRSYQEYDREMKSLYNRLEQAQCKNDLLAIQREIQNLHGKRRIDLSEGNISARTSARIIHELQALWGEVNQKFESFSPIQFSLHWLMETYERNRQNNWVVFVNEVPKAI